MSLPSRRTVLSSSGRRSLMAADPSYFPVHAFSGIARFRRFLLETAAQSLHNTAISIDPRTSGSFSDYIQSNTELRKVVAQVCPSYQLLDASTVRGKFHAHGTGCCAVALETKELRKLGFERHADGWRRVLDDGGEIFIKRMDFARGWINYITGSANLREFQQKKTFEELQKYLGARAVVPPVTAGAIAVKTYSLERLGRLCRAVSSIEKESMDGEPMSLLLRSAVTFTIAVTRATNANTRPKTNVRIIMTCVSGSCSKQKGEVPVFVDRKPGVI